jgi:2'-5' RNA ligase
MKYFIGIVPPEHIREKLTQIQQQFGDNRLEPHITVRPPVSPVNEEDWLDVISSAASRIDPFAIELSGIDRFGTRVLYVRVHAPAITDLYDLLIPQLKEFEPHTIQEKQESFHPHLTLGRTWCGFSQEDFSAMSKLATEYLTSQEIFFVASHIRVYYKPSQQGRYERFRDVRLGNTTSL